MGNSGQRAANGWKHKSGVTLVKEYRACEKTGRPGGVWLPAVLWVSEQWEGGVGDAEGRV